MPKTSIEAAIVRLVKDEGDIKKAADVLLQAWRRAGGTPVDLTEAVYRWRKG